MSIESKIAEAVYLVAISPEAQEKVAHDPELLLRSIAELWPAATEKQIRRAIAIAEELLIADLAELADDHARGVPIVA